MVHPHPPTPPSLLRKILDPPLQGQRQRRRQRQRQRHKTVSLVKKGEIIALNVQHAFGTYFYGTLCNSDVKYANLRFWRLRKHTGVNFSFYSQAPSTSIRIIFESATFSFRIRLPSQRIWRIAHFRVSARLSFKTSPESQPFKCKWVAYSYDSLRNRD